MDQVVKKKQEQLLQCLKKISSKPQTDDEDQKQQLRKFQQEVEQKYKLARHNNEYRFPFEYYDESSDSSLEELQKVGTYDLRKQYQKKQTNSKHLQSSKESIKAKSLIKIMSDKSMKANRQSTRYKTEQYDENQVSYIDALKKNKSIEKQTNEQIISFIRKSVAKRSQYSQHNNNNNNTSRQYINLSSNNQSHIMSQSFNGQKSRTQNYYLNKFTKLKQDMFKQQNQTSTSQMNQDSKISLKYFFGSKSPEQSCTINLKNKLAEMCKRQPLKVIK
ncbi:unnamed protein product [Paramecium primaurelia]|uniref:Uncharacterized protein n=1 Tax=Paramecium primaurelia TaxID=5886 RepID=A0A8S1LCA3_PARPR|nr:unnamed protein product [Paramecium primaurelia]